MPSLLSDLYLGDIAPGMDNVPLSPEYRRLQNLLASREKVLLQTLPEEHKEAFLLYCDTQSHICALSGREDFARGFRLGAQLLLEMLKPYQRP